VGGDVVMNPALAGILVLLMAAAARAQTGPEQDGKNRRPPVRIITIGGGHYGYGYGYGYGGWFGGPRPCLPYSYGGASAYGFSYASPFGGYTYYSGPVTPPGYAWYRCSDYAPPPVIVPRPAEPTPVSVSAREIEEGRRLFKAADYKGAVDAFREAVVADVDNASAQAWFALALAVTGDYRNADKALRAAAERAPFGKVDLKDLFRDAKERARILDILAKGAGEGTLTGAWVRALEGDPAGLKQRAEKDAAARKLLP
jgi:hypothetical protein